MKLSELIKKLQILESRVGDTEVYFTAQDYYSRTLHSLTIDLRTGDTTGLPSDFNGAYTIDNVTRIEFHVGHKGDKKPKITFRS